MGTPEMEKIYQKIVNKVMEMIPEKWTKVYLYGEIPEDVQKGFFYYYSKC